MRRFKFRKHKFDTQRQEIDGYKFQSKAEAERYEQLKLLEAAEKIREIEVHPRFKIVVNGVKICTVVLDFQYYDYENCRHVYEDVKVERRGRDGKVAFSTDTRISKIGRKLLDAVHGIDVNLIYHT